MMWQDDQPTARTRSPLLQHDGGGDRGSQGSAMMISLFCLLVLSMAGAGMSMMVKQDAHITNMMIDQLKALEVAEGAASQALAIVARSTKDLHSPPSEVLTGTLDDGEYSVEIPSYGDGVYAIVATGTIGDINETVRMYVRQPDFDYALSKGIFANGYIDATGNGLVENGSHSNSWTTYSGNTQVIGDADSVQNTTVSGSASVSGSVRSGVSAVAFPKLDLDDYYQVAAANNEVYMGNQVLKGTYSPVGGVMWVVGDVTIKATTTIYGMLVATGDIRQVGRCIQTQHGDFPALASRHGDIRLGGRGQFEGLIYADSGNVDVLGSTQIRGSIAAWGDVHTLGNWGQLDYVRQDPSVKGDARIILLAWEH